jgi:hypothetical protein
MTVLALELAHDCSKALILVPFCTGLAEKDQICLKSCAIQYSFSCRETKQ